MAQVQREKRLHCAAHVASVSAITIRTSGTLEPFTTDPEQGFNCSYIYIYISIIYIYMTRSHVLVQDNGSRDPAAYKAALMRSEQVSIEAVTS